MRPKYYVFIFAESDYGVYQSFYEKKKFKKPHFYGIFMECFWFQKTIKKTNENEFFCIFFI